MLQTTLAGSLPKPTWLAEPERLWAPWKLSGSDLEQAKLDATILAVKLQEDAGLDIVSDGEQARVHFVHGFLANLDGIDFGKKTVIGIRADRYKAEVPTVVGPIRRTGPVHRAEAQAARAHAGRKLKFTLPGPMTIVDTIADEHYGSRRDLAFAFAAALNEEARELESIGIDVVQFDEPAFNVYMREVADWGIAALEAARQGLRCKTAVHICYGYGIKANIDWKETLGSEWRQYEETFPLIARSLIDQVSLECRNSHVPIELIRLLDGKDVLVGAIDVASDEVETPEEVAETIRAALKFVAPEKLYPCTNCGMAPMRREIAYGKLAALAAGAHLVRTELKRGGAEACTLPSRRRSFSWPCSCTRRELTPPPAAVTIWLAVRLRGRADGLPRTARGPCRHLLLRPARPILRLRPFRQLIWRIPGPGGAGDPRLLPAARRGPDPRPRLRHRAPPRPRRPPP